MKITGMKITRSERVVATTASAISAVAEAAASRADSPYSSMWRKMFSWTTTASSTTIPIARISPSIVMLLIVKPMNSMKAKVAIIDVGIESVAISVVRQSRMKRRIVRLTRTAARRRWTCTSWIEFSMKRDWSRMICTSTSSGSTARISSRRCLTASTTATVLVPDCF